MISRRFPVVATLQSRSLPLSLLLRRLSLHGQLDAADEEAVLGLPTHVRNLEPGQYVVREREKATHSCLVVSGFAMRHKIGVDGARQIVNVHVAGDMVDLQNSLLSTADHNVEAHPLTDCQLTAVGTRKPPFSLRPRPRNQDAF